MMRKNVVKRGLSLCLAGVCLSLSTSLVFAEDLMQNNLQSGTNSSTPVNQSSIPTYNEINTETPLAQNTMGTDSGMATENQQQSYTIPAGTNLTIRPVTSTQTLQVGDSYTGRIVNPVVLNGQTVIPAGSTVTGTVTAVNPANNTLSIQFQQLSLANGGTVPIRSCATVARLFGGVQQATGCCVQQAKPATYYLSTIYPRVTIGPPACTPLGRIAESTLAGGIFGGAVGTLTGLVMPAVYRSSINFGEGTGAARGLAWGAAFGGGLGLLTGLVTEGLNHRACSVTTACARPAETPCAQPACAQPPSIYTATGIPTCQPTNITPGCTTPRAKKVKECPVACPACGAPSPCAVHPAACGTCAPREIPTAYQPMVQPDFNIILQEPVSVPM